MNLIIPQNFTHYKDLNAFKKNKPTEGSLDFSDDIFYTNKSTLKVEDLLDYERLFILAEPGYGKSTQLENLKKYLKQESINFKFYYGKNDNIGDNEITIDEEDKFLIYDALDENKDIPNTISKLLEITAGRSIRLIISNRTHFQERIEHLIENQNFEFIRLLPFDQNQIHDYLEDILSGIEVDTETIKTLISNSSSGADNSIFSTPRYLNEFCRYIKDSKLPAEDIKAFKKSDLFDKVIFYKLKTGNDGNSNRIFLTKRVLERLALIMEIHGLNQISKEDFITFLDQTNSNINLIFLNNIDLDELLERVMKTTGDLLEFEHTEFQEYLAAKELSRLGYRYQTIYDLMIDPKLGYMKSNWIDVLNYAIDIDAEFIKPLVRFIETRNFESIDEKLIEIILNSDIKIENDSFLDLLFKTIFNFYSSKGKYIFNKYGQLSKFITPSNDDIRYPLYKKDEILDANTHSVANQIMLIGTLAKDEGLDQSSIKAWKRYLSSLLKSDKFHHIYDTIFYTFISFKDPIPLLQQITRFEEKEDYVLNKLFYPLGKLAPNHSQTIDLINRCLNSGRRLDNLINLVNHVSSESGLLSVFESITNNLKILNRHFKYTYCYTLLENVKRLNSSKLDQQIEYFVVALFNSDQYIDFKINVVELSIRHALKRNSKLLDQIKGTRTFLYSLEDIVKPIVREVDLDTFKELERFIQKTQKGWHHHRLIRLSTQEVSKDNPIYQYIDEAYLKKQKPQQIEETDVLSDEEKLLNELHSHYLADSERYNNLIPFFIGKSDKLIPLLDDKDINTLETVIEKVIEQYDPDSFQLKIIKMDESGTRFTHNHPTWFSIESYFKAAYLLKQNNILIKHRAKFLKTLPLLGHYYDKLFEEFLKNVLDIIGKLTTEDIQLIYDFCVDRTDDIILFNAKSFAENVNKLNLHQLIPVLYLLLNNERIDSFSSEKVLETLGELSSTNEHKEILLEIFESPKTTSKQKENANFFLIKKFQDKNAIEWRLNQLKARLKPFNVDSRYNGVRGVSAFENELDNPQFPTCFYGIENRSIYDGMLDILDFSFSIRVDRNNFSYSNYLQTMVYNYFRTFIDEDILQDLRRVSTNHSKSEHTYSFGTYIDKLIEELHLIKKSEEPFIAAVHTANHIISNKYLPIQSHLELRQLILSVIDNEIRNLIENEGFYKVISELSDKKRYPNEALIQKTLKIALEKELLEKGLRKSDIHREVESHGGLKYDFIISYGLYGPIMVEIKLLHNTEIQNKKKRNAYKKKLERYMQANNGMGIYAIFQTKDTKGHREKYVQLVDEYKDLKGLEIVSFKCFNDNENSL